jgi:hypothetical protein
MKYYWYVLEVFIILLKSTTLSFQVKLSQNGE